MIKKYFLPDSYPVFFDNIGKYTGVVGIDYNNNIVDIDFSKYHHLLIAGATGQGKSTALKTLICSLIANNFSDEIQFIFIDLKRVELSQFKKIPHCVYFCSDIKECERLLEKVIKIINNRFETLEKFGRTSISELENFSNIFVVIDEFSELILSNKKIESLVVRVSQIGRSAGVHLILCTQLPTAKIITNLINVNISCKVALRVETSNNSRAIINQKGAEMLTAPGDALIKKGIGLERFRVFKTPSEDIKKIVGFWSGQKQGPLFTNLSML